MAGILVGQDKSTQWLDHALVPFRVFFLAFFFLGAVSLSITTSVTVKAYDLFKLSISLSDKDLELLKGLAQRINELQNLKEE